MSNHIDRIIYINLAKRTDRREQIEKELDDYGLIYERFDAIETPGMGILGCGYSHLAVLKMAKERGYKNVLILEDDFTFLESREVVESELVRFFDSEVDYDVCMISYNLKRVADSEYDFLYRSQEVQTASGYIVNARYYDTLIGLFEDAFPKLAETGAHWLYANDQVWKPLQTRDVWYCFKTRLGKQRDGFSDNTGKYENYTDC